MENGMSKAVAAPVDFEVGGETLQLHPLNFLDWGIIEGWVRAEIIKAGMAAGIDYIDANKQAVRVTAGSLLVDITSNATESKEAKADDEQGGADDEQSKEADDEQKKKKGMEFLAAGGMLQSFGGMLKIVFLSVKHGYAGITNDKLMGLLGNNYIDLYRAWTAVINLSLPGVVEETEGDSKNVPPTE
jgi:hypothetical protein